MSRLVGSGVARAMLVVSICLPLTACSEAEPSPSVPVAPEPASEQAPSVAADLPSEVREGIRDIAREQSSARGVLEVHLAYRYPASGPLPAWLPRVDHAEVVAVDVTLVPDSDRFDLDDIEIAPATNPGEGFETLPARLFRDEDGFVVRPRELGSSYRVVLFGAVPTGTTHVSLYYWGEALAERVPLAPTGPAPQGDPDSWI